MKKFSKNVTVFRKKYVYKYEDPFKRGGMAVNMELNLVCEYDSYITEMFWSRSDEAISVADKRYHGLLFSIIATILQNDADAEECLNDVYLKIWESIPPNRPSSFCAYAIKVARNTAINLIRVHRAQKRAANESLEFFDAGGTAINASEIVDIEESRHIGEIINRYLNSVDERKMYIFMSRYFFNKPISEIARKLNCSQSTVHKEIRRIKDELREQLTEGGIYV